MRIRRSTTSVVVVVVDVIIEREEEAQHKQVELQEAYLLWHQNLVHFENQNSHLFLSLSLSQMNAYYGFCVTVVAVLVAEFLDESQEHQRWRERKRKVRWSLWCESNGTVIVIFSFTHLRIHALVYR